MSLSRHTLIKSGIVAGFPAIVPARVLGAGAPSKRINVGAIGVGRISRGHDMKEVLKHRDAHIVAVCDLDTHHSVRTRAPVSAPAEIGHRAYLTCLLHWIAMKTGRRLHWDPAAERFIGDDAADAMLSRPQRAGYAIVRFPGA